MPCAQGSRSLLSYLEEVTRGTTPAGNFQRLPFSTQSLELTKETIEGTDITGDRMQSVSRHGNRSVGGDIVADLRDAEYDAFLESAFLNTWTSDVLTPGLIPKYFSIEDYASDIDQARLFTGCTVSQVSFSLAPNQMITTTYTMLGEDMEVTTTEKTVDASAGNVPFDSYSGVLQLGDSGGTLTTVGYVTAMDITLNNNMSSTFTVGSDTSSCYSIGDAMVEGSLTCIYQDADLINRFLDEEESALSVSVGEPGDPGMYTFFVPRAKFNSANAPVGGSELRTIEIAFVGLKDATEGYNLSLTRPTTL